MTITLAKALVLRKQYSTKVQELSKRFVQSSSTKKLDMELKPVWENYNPQEILDEMLFVTSKLTALKILINEANAKIQEKIFTLSELKSWCKTLQTMTIVSEIQERVVVGGQMTTQAIPIHNFYTIVKRNQMVDNLRETISGLQDELNTFNHQTTKEVPFEV